MSERHVALVDDGDVEIELCNYCGEFTSDENHYGVSEVGSCCGGSLVPTRCPNCNRGLRAVAIPSPAALRADERT